VPQYKCKKDYYKQLVHQALSESNIYSLLGGAEYAENIVNNMEKLDSLFSQNSGFEFFIKEMRAFFKGVNEHLSDVR
jgi:hypothetical protein